MYVFFHKIKECFLAEQERWFLWLPVLFGCGIGGYFLLPVEPSLWVSAIGVEVLIVMAFLWRFNYFRLMFLGRRCSCGCGICEYSAENYLSAKAGDIA